MNKEQFDKVFKESVKENSSKVSEDFIKTVNNFSVKHEGKDSSLYAAILVESVKYCNNLLYSVLSKVLINED
jgi:hypothetical protein